MKKHILLSILPLLPLLCAAQKGTLKIYLYDPNQKFGHFYTQIYLGDYENVPAIDLDGNYLLDSVLAGEYDLKISSVYYPDTTFHSIKITAGQTTSLVFEYPPPCPYKPYSKKKKRCPVCKRRDKVIPIVYGFPGGETLISASKGKIKLGGCELSFCDPHWYCKRDNRDF